MARPPQRVKQGGIVKASDYNDLLEFAKGNVVSGSSHINVERMAGRTLISANGSLLRKGGSAGGGDTYDGYFKVTNSSTTAPFVTQVTISEGLIILGLSTVEFDESNLVVTEVSTGQLGYISLYVTYDTEAEISQYVVTPTFEIGFPDQENDTLKIILAKVITNGTGETLIISDLTQLHYGVHYGAGRVF